MSSCVSIGAALVPAVGCFRGEVRALPGSGRGAVRAGAMESGHEHLSVSCARALAACSGRLCQSPASSDQRRTACRKASCGSGISASWPTVVDVTAWRRSEPRAKRKLLKPPSARRPRKHRTGPARSAAEDVCVLSARSHRKHGREVTPADSLDLDRRARPAAEQAAVRSAAAFVLNTEIVEKMMRPRAVSEPIRYLLTPLSPLPPLSRGILCPSPVDNRSRTKYNPLSISWTAPALTARGVAV